MTADIGRTVQTEGADGARRAGGYGVSVGAVLALDAAHVYGGLVATLTAWCEHHGIPYAGVPVGTWKRDLTGKGNADKAAVMAAVRELGYAPETQDEADALGVLHHGNG